MSFGSILQEIREAAGMSQTELAAKAGVSIDSLRNWEQDRVLPRIDTAGRLAKALNVSLDRLVVEEKPKRKGKP